MGIIRSVTTKQSAAPDIEYRIGRHQPYKHEGYGHMEEDGDPYTVVEMWLRGSDGEWGMKGSFKMEDFVDLARDVVRIGKELMLDSEDEASGGEAV